MQMGARQAESAPEPQTAAAVRHRVRTTGPTSSSDPKFPILFALFLEIGRFPDLNLDINELMSDLKSDVSFC